MPFDAVCKGCWHHGDSDGSSGQCRALPPDMPNALPPRPGEHPVTFPVMVMAYTRTADECPACGLYRPKVEPEAPPVETKAERIARLCKAPVTDLAAFKREIDGR